MPLGCAQVVKERGHDQVGARVEQRTRFKTRWEKGPPQDAQIAAWVRQLSKGGLTRTTAVEIALVNSPTLQIEYEELGISQADMVQAGLLSNPTLGVNYGFATTTGAVSEVSFSLTQNFLDLFVLPLRKEIARDQFETDTLRLTHRVLETVAEVEKAFVTAQTSSELVAFRRTVVETAEAAAELSERQFEAGNVSVLDRSTERATFEQTKLDLVRAEFELLESRERVNRLLGLWGETTAWTLAEKLPDLPVTEPTLQHLESTAVERRFDVAAARRQALLLGKAVRMARSTRLFGRIEIGVDAHRDPDGPRVIGPHLVLDLPLFDQRQAFIARLEAQQRQQERRLSGLAIEARSDVRLAEARLRGSRQVALHYRDVLVPLRKAVVDQALLHYNGMFISLFQLLVVKQAEVEARRGYLESVRDYWSARADLAHAVGGQLPPPRAPAPTPLPSPAPSPSPSGVGTGAPSSEGTHQHGK